MKKIFFKALFVLFISLPLANTLANANSETAGNNADLNSKLETIWQETKNDYLKLDLTYSEKSEWHRPRFIQKNQKKELVYVLHGFMGTPFEMKIFEEKASLLGYDVYNDLIFGYGDRPEMVNLTKNTEWIALFYKKLDILLPHYEKIHFVGFSTGGLMISHMLFDRQSMIGEKLGSITLISPFYEPDLFLGRFLLKIVGFFVDTISSDLPYDLIRYPDVVVMMKHRENFMQKIPVKAAQQVMDLADQFSTKAKESLGNFPQMTVYMTPNDRVADYDFTKKFLPKIFNNMKFITLEGERAPHHLMVKSVSQHADLLYDQFLIPESH